MRCLRPFSTVILLSLLLVLPARGTPSECIDYAEYLHWIGSIGLDVAPREVVLSGTLAFAATGDLSYGSLDVIDISDSSAPALVTRLGTGGFARDIVLRGDHAFLAVEGVGLVIADITSPASPIVVGTCGMSLGGYGVAAANHFAYVVNYAGLRVVDVSDVEHPVVRGAVETSGFAVGVGVDGTLAYVADGYSGLVVVDVSDAASPRIVGRVDTPGFAYAAIPAGEVVYVPDREQGLAVVSVADPAAPVIVSQLAVPGEVWDMGIEGDRGYMTGHGGGLTILDLTDPTAPEIAGGFALGGEDVAVAGALVCVADGRENLHFVDVTSPDTPPLVGHTETPGRAWDVALSGDYAYVADDWQGGLQIIDITIPTGPRIVGNAPVFGANELAMAPPLVYVAMRDLGLRIVDVSDPTAPVILGGASIGGGARGVAVSGHHAYVAGHTLNVLDVTNPAAPVLLAEVPTGDEFPSRLAITGNHLYITTLGAGLLIADITEPATPRFIGHADLPSYYTYGVMVSNGFAYVAGEGFPTREDLMILDVSDPTAPVLTGTVGFRGRARDVVVHGHYAYVASYYGGWLEVVDVRDPASPRIVGNRATAGGSAGVATNGREVYVAGGNGGVFVLPMQCDIPVPVEIGSFVAIPESGGIRVAWSVGESSGLLAFHLHRSETVGLQGRRIHSIDPPTAAGPGPFAFLDSNVVPRITYFYRLEAVDTRGRVTLHGPAAAQAAGGARLAPAIRVRAANPLTSDAFPAVVEFDAGGPGRVRVSLCDVSGRLVVLLHDGATGSGTQAVSWDGRAASGHPIPAGIYFVRLDTDGATISRRVVVVP